MRNNINTALICCLFILFGSSLKAQVNHLKKDITIDLQQIALQDALEKIGDAGDFQFSYNSEIIPGDSLISLNAQKKQTQDILTSLLGEEIRYKVLGNHIILLPPEQGRRSSRPNRDIQYSVKGYVYNAATGEILARASIYELDERNISSSNDEGFYTLSVPGDQESQMLSYSKSGFKDTLIIVRPKEQPEMNIYLVPEPVEVEVEKPQLAVIEEQPSIPSRSPGNINNRKMVAALVPGQTLLAAENIPLIEERFLQVSFLPFLGSNRFISGIISNNISLNILAGYAGGVRGAEFGGFMNIVRNHVSGLQAAGFGNIVGKKTKGVQVAGFFNINAGSLAGLQGAGFSNVVMDTIKGVQLAGFSNVLRGAMHGIQVSGFSNFTSQNVDGIQLAGFSNVAIKDVRLSQISGFANYGRNVKGLQIAGFMNIASGTSFGGQVSGFLNYATELKGVQLSVFNVADTVSVGIPIGFMSFVLKGYHPVEISANELFPVNLTLKTGVNSFYNIVTAGWSGKAFTGGYGVGSRIPFSSKMGWSNDLTAHYIGSVQDQASFQASMLRLTSSIDIKLLNHLSVYLGPQISAYGYGNSNDPDADQIPVLATLDLYQADWDYFHMKVWLGATFGLRF